MTLDCALGGGWALGRMANVIGDNSTGKTLLAIEACANAVRQYDAMMIWYREAEAAFDMEYAKALGMPLERINPGEKKWWKPRTAEELDTDIAKQVDKAIRANRPGLYILDSLDALSSDAELERDRKKREKDEDGGSYNLDKQKQLSALFRKRVQDIEASCVHLMIISQTRANIGVKFGPKYSISGGNAMKFYASQRVMLAHVANLVDQYRGIKRVTGVRVRAKVIKNKVGLPLREAEFVLRFGFGMESVEAGIDWLIDIKRTDALGLSIEKAKALRDQAYDWTSEEYAAQTQRINAVVKRVWSEVETGFLPERRKYI